MSCPTPQQMDTLLNFLEKNRDLALGNLRNMEGRMRSRKLWDEITSTLNAMGGCTKSVQQWQRVWSDKKYLAKKAAGVGPRTSVSTTPTCLDLSDCDIKILGILKDGGGGHQTTSSMPALERETQEYSESEVTAEFLEDKNVEYLEDDPEISRHSLPKVTKLERVYLRCNTDNERHSNEDYRIFGEYVASELQGLSPRGAKKLKLMIAKSILEVTQEEFDNNVNL